MKPTLRQIAIGATLFLSGAAFVCAQGDAKDLYLGKCASCHGPDGAGKTAMGKKMKVPDVKALVPKVSAAEMEKAVANGKGENMDGFSKQFNKDQIKGLVEHYRGLAN
jgi:mono/diheme cytochrome c family protein